MPHFSTVFFFIMMAATCAIHLSLFGLSIWTRKKRLGAPFPLSFYLFTVVGSALATVGGYLRLTEPVHLYVSAGDLFIMAGLSLTLIGLALSRKPILNAFISQGDGTLQGFLVAHWQRLQAVRTAAKEKR